MSDVSNAGINMVRELYRKNTRYYCRYKRAVTIITVLIDLTIIVFL